MQSQPWPEPAGDIRAQITATLDPAHPKRACFLVPADALHLQPDALPEGVYMVARSEGALVTADRDLAEKFDTCPANLPDFDEALAEILGYPEPKPQVEAWCQGDDARARTVQARDAQGHVITEALAGLRFLETCSALQAHVPPGGQLVIMPATAVLARRVAMRWVDG